MPMGRSGEVPGPIILNDDRWGVLGSIIPNAKEEREGVRGYHIQFTAGTLSSILSLDRTTPGSSMLGQGIIISD